ncbi:class I SAM-dependent methyltransferase [Sedimentitalea sp. JM2-8]|uniref:Class I SAM-dependent methyltransferase n=1 Tax=Sedimentitalea xiamensis TaxID=3050037 RepID=A0ABT7FKL0_9RHOB|nr:class I SAM-dependent methyltransferase [Sedimentitalea xiamensis]MDK3075684.1 class I SAM-dependent methyltransferase [Sedimentitalea xiamensis]
MTSKLLRWLNRRLNGVVGYRDEMGTHGTYDFSHGRHAADRIALVNHLVSLYDYDDYLEIGVRRKADMHDRIIARNRISVDPAEDAEADFNMTSDAFFSQNRKVFDIVFIDGLHTGEQVYRDIENSLAALKPGGCILLHDLNPPTAQHAREIYELDGAYPAWNGTSWQGYARFRKEEPNLEMYVVDVDWGVGFVRRGRQKCYPGAIGSYDDLERDRSEILNLVSVRDFLQRHPSQRLDWSPFDPLKRRFARYST